MLKFDVLKRAEDATGDTASEADSIEVEEVTDHRREAWEQVKQAGVVFWQNTATGEAQMHNPFLDEGSIIEEEGLPTAG